MDKSEITVVEQGIVSQVTQFETYLDTLGLPSENIIASIEERGRIMQMLPQLISELPDEQKRDARYLSKFVAGAAIGLFDASLNFVWDEVVVSLRKKIVFYGIDTFYDSAVSEKYRDQYKDEEDLSGIKDKVMLDNLKKLEWISDIVYRKLCHILDMRNQIGASHPNTYDINAFELLGWLQTCVKEVIADKPSNTAIQIREIIENLKKNEQIIDSVTLESIEKAVSEFSSGMAGNLLRSLFGLYVADDTDPEIRQNILLLSAVVWKYCKDDIKYDLGEKKQLYRNNLQKEKEALAYTFFEKCDGLRYFSLDERSLQLSSLCDELCSAHNGWDNYYHEPPYAREIMKYIKKPSDIPEDRMVKIINTFLMCRIGREVSYCGGVSQGALQYYDRLFEILTEEQVKVVLAEFRNHLDSIYNGNGVRAKNAAAIVKKLRRDEFSDRLKEIIDYMIGFADRKIINKVYHDKGFKDVASGVLNLS